MDNIPRRRLALAEQLCEEFNRLVPILYGSYLLSSKKPKRTVVHYTLDYETTEQKENINQLELIHLNAVLALVRFSL